MKSSVPSQLVKTVKAAPKPGLELVLVMLSEGRVGLDEPTEEGLGLMDALIDHALHGGGTRAHQSLSGNLSQGLFSVESLPRWLAASENKVFSRKDRNGVWVPLAFLRAVEMASLTKNPETKKSIPQKKDLDKWLPKVIEALPQLFWEEAGGAFLAQALSMDLAATVHQSWVRTSPLALDDKGVPALLHAKRGTEWLRFINEGGDPTVLVEKEPLWKVVLEACKQKPARSKDSFVGAFEDWFVQWAATRPELKTAVHGLAQARLGNLSGYSPERWINVFQASQGDWPNWSTRKSEPLWACVARGSSLEFFDAMEQAPSLLAKIDRSEYAKIKMEAIIQSLAVETTDTLARNERLSDTVKSQGWHPALIPYAPRFARLPLDMYSAQFARKLSLDHGKAWWGEDVNREQVEKDLFLMLPGFAKINKARLNAWVEVVADSEPSAWLEVGRGFACAIKGKMEDLHSVDRTCLSVVARDPEGMAAMEDMAKSFIGVRRKEFNVWLESAKLEAFAPRVQLSRSSPRL